MAPTAGRNQNQLIGIEEREDQASAALEEYIEWSASSNTFSESLIARCAEQRETNACLSPGITVTSAPALIGPDQPNSVDSRLVEAGPRTGLSAVDDMLAAPFETTHHDVRGGVPIDYLTGEQVISRLLQVLGSCGWSFRVLQHDIHVEADEVWVLGELRLLLNGDDAVVRQQFGSSKIKRARATGAPLDIGFDLKSAATDCLKKCATLVGVGLCLTRKEEEPRRGGPSATEPNGAKQHMQRQRSSSTRRPIVSPTPSESELTPSCEQCGQQLQSTQTRDGRTWTPAELAAYTLQHHNRTLCAECVRSAHAATVQTRATSEDPRTASQPIG